MWQRVHETIAAVASAPGRGARLIIRISGLHAWQAASRVFVTETGPLGAEPTEAVVIRGFLDWEELPTAVPCDLYYWAAGRSYTGQPSVELHTINCRPLAERILQELGVRLAAPGEFTLRAFLSGRIDLTQAEAVLGVIDARGEPELEVALQQLAGGVAKPLRAIRSDLLDLLADIEAGLDFAEEDLPFLTWDELTQRVTAIRDQLERVAQQFTSRRDTAELPRVVLLGPPNSGKSTLFNALIGNDRAIVSPIPGTTRDYLTAICYHKGVRFELIDTAGIEEIEDVAINEAAPSEEDNVSNSAAAGPGQNIEHLATHATFFARRQADVRLFCWPVDRDPEPAWSLFPGQPEQGRLIVFTKGDLLKTPTSLPLDIGIVVSAKEQTGLAALKDLILAELSKRPETTAGVIAETAMRCQTSLVRAHEALHQALTLIDRRESEELIAAAIRTALDEIGQVTGEIYTEELLDRVFSRFCIGK